MTKKDLSKSKSTLYDIFSGSAPMMPKFGKGTESLKLLTSQVTKDMREAIVPMVFPAFASHLTNVKVMFSSNEYHELCGQMGHLIGASGIGKGELTRSVEAICRDLREHDNAEFQKLDDWQRQVKSLGSNKTKPERPSVCFRFPPSNVTNPAFLQNALACEINGNYSQYYNMTEVEMADRICGGHKNVSQMVRNIYDVQRDGALRATCDGVTGSPIFRVNITFSSTPDAARQFYKRDLTNGFFGRIPFSYKARGERKGKIPRQGKYDEGFLTELDEYIHRLQACSGTFIIKPLNKVADHLSEDIARIADLADDDMIWDIGKRCILSAWKKGALLWLMNNQEWTRSIGEFVIWFCYYDLWSKIQVFGDMFKGDFGQSSDDKRNGPKNMLDSLNDTFNELELETLRLNSNKSKEGTKHQLNVWKNRGFITYSAQTGLYTKTEAYLKRK